MLHLGCAWQFLGQAIDDITTTALRRALERHNADISFGGESP